LQRPSDAQQSDVRHFLDSHLAHLLSALSIVIAATLIVGPVLALNVVNNSNARLGITIAFIVLFAIGLGVSTSVSRDNNFTATATYSAVLVVFVSGNLGNVGNVSTATGASRIPRPMGERPE
jgi:hypothetical protein